MRSAKQARALRHWPAIQICRADDDLGSAMLLHYSLTRYVGLERTMGIGDLRTCRRVDDSILLASAVFPRSPWASAARPQLPESLFQAPARTGRSVELGGSQGRAGPDAITAFRQKRRKPRVGHGATGNLRGTPARNTRNENPRLFSNGSIRASISKTG